MADKRKKPAPKRKPARKSAKQSEPRARRYFPIVGIGASAGGLEALEEFLRNVRTDAGIAYVVIQHLDPSYKGMLVELLQRASPIPVAEASEGLTIEPDHVYVIPANADMALTRGTLHVLALSRPRGLHHPIDFFLRSLAEDLQERSIGVILSGMGSDGTLGLRAIKEKAGATFVQSLASAKFDSMPRTAIESGLADVVAPAEQLPERIRAYVQHTPYAAPTDVHLETKAQNALEKVFVLLRAHTGNDFSLYKRSTIYRRIERRMGLHQIASIEHYVRYLRENPREVELLFKELLIGVTSFFRDPGEWQRLEDDLLPGLLSSRSSIGVVRAWVPGCSTGEEAYSLAIAFKEALEPFKSVKNIALQVFATDLDRDAIARARQGAYPDNIAADVSPERLRRFFIHEEHGYQISKEIRESVVFAPQNITMDPPFTKVDIVCCRNLMIYLSSELQKRLIPLFHYSLNPGGILMLGSSETVGQFSNLFAPLDAKSRLYRRLEQPINMLPIELRTAPFGTRTTAAGNQELEPAVIKQAAPNVQILADRVLVQRFSPLGILCSEKGDILYVSNRSGKYFEPAVGKANLNVFAMARDGLRYELAGAFAAAIRDERAVTVRGLKVGSNGGTQIVDLTVQKLKEPKDLAGTVMVVIDDVPTTTPAKAPRKRQATQPRVAELELELDRAREEAQTVREEMQTSQEELKSTNEELQSTNEELQSTNEELTTSKEEMQSLNEELQTVNQELQSKVDELSRSNNDMKNLLNSTDIATLFLDANLRVRRFTTPTAKIIKLIPGDTGRSITDFASDLDYSELAEDAREVLRTLVFREKQAVTRDGRWFVVRIMPYRTLENVIDGVVITFSDASSSKALEHALLEQQSQLRQLAETMQTLVWSCHPDGTCDYFSPQWLEYTGVEEIHQLRWGWLDRVHPDDREDVRSKWKAAVKAAKTLDLEFRIRSAKGAFRWFSTRWIPLFDPAGKLTKWYASSVDVDEVKRMRDALDVCREGVVVLDRDHVVTSINTAAARMLGRDRQKLVGTKLADAFPDAAALLRDAGTRTSAAKLADHAVRVHAQGDGLVLVLD